MKLYWDRHLFIDPAIAGLAAVILWIAPSAGIGPIWVVNPEYLSDLLSRWLAGNLTLIGLIIATTGFISTVLDRDEFLPLAKSSSSAQLWEILRQSLGWLFVSAAYCFVGSISQASLPIAFIMVGTFLGLVVFISLGKLVWVMRSILGVKMRNARSGRGRPH